MCSIYVSNSLPVKSRVGLLLLDAQTPQRGFPASDRGDKKFKSRQPPRQDLRTSVTSICARKPKYPAR